MSLAELQGAVADELAHEFDELLQPRRLAIPDPIERIAAGCGAFVGEALRNPAWGGLVARGAASMPNFARTARQRLVEDIRLPRLSGRLGDSDARTRLRIRVRHRTAGDAGRGAARLAPGRRGRSRRGRTARDRRGAGSRREIIAIASPRFDRRARKRAAGASLVQTSSGEGRETWQSIWSDYVERRSALGRRPGRRRLAAGRRLPDHRGADRTWRGETGEPRRRPPSIAWTPSNCSRR